MVNTPNLGMPELSESQAAKFLTHNEALRIADVMMQPVAVSKTVSTPPGSPASGVMYIVGPAATGVWAGHEDELTYYRLSEWRFIVPKTGFHVWLESDDEYVVYQGSVGWVPALENPFYDIGAGVNDTPTNSQVLLRAPMVRDVSFPDEFAGSYAIAAVAATAQAVFLIKRDGAQVGTITFAASGTTGTFATSGGSVAFAPGEVLTIEAPATADDTLADIGITLKGTKI